MCRMMMSVISLKRLRLRLSEYNKKFAFELSNVSRLEQGSRRILLDEDPESSLAVDFVDYPHDSANTEQAWFALAALAVLLLSLLA